MTQTARVNGHTYEIPDMWIVGWVQGRRREGYDVTAHDALLYWDDQAQLEAQFNAQRHAERVPADSSAGIRSASSPGE